jgi:hypothetical protein
VRRGGGQPSAPANQSTPVFSSTVRVLFSGFFRCLLLLSRFRLPCGGGGGGSVNAGDGVAASSHHVFPASESLLSGFVSFLFFFRFYF